MGMPASASSRRWTAAEVRDLIREDRAWPRDELIGGELLVTPSPVKAHQRAVAEVLMRLKSYVDAAGIPYEVFSSPADLAVERWQHDEMLARVDDERLEWRPSGATERLVIDLPALFARMHRDA
jgi:Uma2 family endonuclease